MPKRINIYFDDDSILYIDKIASQFNGKRSTAAQYIIKEYEALQSGNNDVVAQKLITSLTNIVDIKNDEIVTELKKSINELAIQTAMNNELLLGLVDIDDDQLKEIRLKAVDQIYGTDYYSKSKKY